MDNQRTKCHFKGTRAVNDLGIISATSLAVFFVSSYFDINNYVEKFTFHHERPRIGSWPHVILLAKSPRVMRRRQPSSAGRTG